MRKDLLWLEEQESYRALVDDPDANLSGRESAHQQRKRERLEEIARKEVRWFFRTLGGRVPDAGSAFADARPAAQKIHEWLETIRAFHRGALSLRYTPKVWPALLAKHYGKWTSLVVRLECALHPSGGKGSPKVLEQAAVERLEEVLQKRGRDRHDLLSRAWSHEHLAIRAYLEVRGEGPCVLPRKAGGSAAREERRELDFDVSAAEAATGEATVSEAPATDAPATEAAVAADHSDEGARS